MQFSCLSRERIRLQKKFQKQFGVRQKWDQKSQVVYLYQNSVQEFDFWG